MAPGQMISTDKQPIPLGATLTLKLHSQPARPHLEPSLLHQQVLRRGRPCLQRLPQRVYLQGRLQISVLTGVWLTLLPAGDTAGCTSERVTAETCGHWQPDQCTITFQVLSESRRPESMPGVKLFTCTANGWQGALTREVEQAMTLSMLGSAADIKLCPGGVNF